MKGQNVKTDTRGYSTGEGDVNGRGGRGEWLVTATDNRDIDLTRKHTQIHTNTRSHTHTSFHPPLYLLSLSHTHIYIYIYIRKFAPLIEIESPDEWSIKCTSNDDIRFTMLVLLRTREGESFFYPRYLRYITQPVGLF